LFKILVSKINKRKLVRKNNYQVAGVSVSECSSNSTAYSWSGCFTVAYTISLGEGSGPALALPFRQPLSLSFLAGGEIEFLRNNKSKNDNSGDKSFN
jgi:hypothetical protein